MSRHEIIVTDTVGDQIEEIVGGGLNAHNDEVTGYADGQPLAVLTALMITEGIVESRRQTPSPALREKVASEASRMRVRRASALGRRKRHAPHPPTSWAPLQRCRRGDFVGPRRYKTVLQLAGQTSPLEIEL